MRFTPPLLAADGTRKASQPNSCPIRPTACVSASRPAFCSSRHGSSRIRRSETRRAERVFPSVRSSILASRTLTETVTPGHRGLDREPVVPEVGQDFVECRVRVEARVDGRKAPGRVPTGTGCLTANAAQKVVLVRVTERRRSIDRPGPPNGPRATALHAWRSRSDSGCSISFLFFSLDFRC